VATITPTNEAKNSLTITNEAKVSGKTRKWSEADWPWSEADGTWELPGVHIAKEAKNSLSITNESKT